MRRVCALVALFFLINPVIGQEKAGKPDFLVMFYNTENLFDYFDDAFTQDEEFLPASKRHWTKERYNDKLIKVSKVILSAGIDAPSFVGFAEVENYKVLKDLISNTPLNKFEYRILHYESPDPRGIDVAAIYRADKLKILDSKALRITFPNDPKRKTRDILYVKGLTHLKDTLHFFVNHWPSRRGGQKASELNRKFVASFLKKHIDSVFKSSSKAKIIITGDFNDEPDDHSLFHVLKTIAPESNTTTPGELVNLSHPWIKNASLIGTHRFRGKWGILDQIIVSDFLLQKQGLYCKTESARILNLPFLLQDDKNFGGSGTYRTYTGMKYTGGFSDHLPVILELYKN